MLEIDKSIPLYQQLYSDLKALIQNGAYTPGDPLPTQREMEAQYGVSRATVRKAQGLLEKDGYIRVEQGKGAFVAKTFATPDARADFSFADRLLRQNKATANRLLSQELVAAAPKIAQALQIAPQTEVIRIQRLWLINETPIALDTSYLSPKFNFIFQADFSDRGILDVLQKDLGVVIARQHKTAQACLATPAQLAALDLTPPAALLCASRASYNQAGEIVEHTTTALPGHKIRLNLSAGEYELHEAST
ncbi:MAG: GntR family transcriptional regulator [Anaerolineales bacterium]